MSAQPIVGLGTVVGFGNVANSFTTLSGVDSVSFSGDKVSTSKTTNMLSTNGYDTYIPGTKEPGTCDIKAFLWPGDVSQSTIETFRTAAELVYFQIAYTASNNRSFTGYVESATPSFQIDKPATIDYKVKISGPVTIV